jgi:threonine aldolase
MRRAMADAEVGDDEYGEDPTVNRLQSLVAGLLGTEASLYVPSGTMANQLAIRVLSRPGTEVLCPARSHVYQYELAASPQNSGVQMHPLWDVPDGIVAALDGSTYEFPPISMLTLENTYMAMSGAPTGVDEMRTLVGLGHNGGLRVHVDGARIWNAAIATGSSPAELIGGADTAMFCLSKGLGAPVGSMLCGPADVIAEARVHRRRLGGGMRQAGVIAAAGIVALETMIGRLQEDHEAARRLAKGLAWLDPALADSDQVQTNILRMDVSGSTRDATDWASALAGHGILVQASGAKQLRLVTHRHIDREAVDRTIAAFAAVAGNG